jgi:uncharacterized repeat protein (TIGR01451 family)
MAAMRCPARWSSILASCALGLTLTLAALATIAGPPAQAASVVRYVAPGGKDSGNQCAASAYPCASVQHAVDVATPGDEIRVAEGTYTGVSVRAGMTQTVYVGKSITIRGGYTQSNWTAPDPTNHPTTLDALRLGRVLVISGPITVTVEGLRITGGNAQNSEGGGVYVTTATITLNNNIIADNAAYEGGGLCVEQSRYASLNNNVISGNTISWAGGGVYISGCGDVSLNGNLIDANFGDGDYSRGGGLVVIANSHVALSGNTISRNRAGEGGGIEVAIGRDNLLSHNTIISNSSRYFGGVFLSAWGYTRLDDNFISGNQGEAGGGVAMFESQATFQANTIVSNTASYQGGGLWVGGGSQALLNDNLIRENEAHETGGGLWITGETALTNTVIADNRATLAGSGLYLNALGARLLHTTIARNTGGDGSGIYLPYSGCAVTLTNTILVSQTVGITAAAGGTATLDGVLWFANGANSAGAGTIVATNEYTGDPAFAADGYHLTPASAALDRGIDAGVETDIDGQPRPFGLAPDLGADEGQPALAVSKTASAELARPGFPLTYTLHVTNTGFVDLNATITDTLPDQVTPSGVRTWTATVPAFGGVWIGQVTVAVAPEASGLLTNQVEVTSAEGASGQFTQTTRVGHWFYFPVILRGR